MYELLVNFVYNVLVYLLFFLDSIILFCFVNSLFEYI